MALSRVPRIARLRYIMREYPGSIRLEDLDPHDFELIMALDGGINEHFAAKRDGGGVITE